LKVFVDADVEGETPVVWQPNITKALRSSKMTMIGWVVIVRRIL